MAKSYWDQDLDEFNPYYSHNKDGSSKLNSRSEKEASTSFLQNSEKSALSTNEPGFHYSGKGKNAASKNPKINFSGKRKGAALIVIIGLFIGGGVFLGSSNTLLPAALNSVLPTITQFDNASHATRQEQIIAAMSSGQKVSGWNNVYYKMSNWLKSRFTGTSDNINIDGDSIYFDGENVSGSNFITASNNNAELRNVTNKATQGNVANYYDQPANNTIELMTGNNRNVMKDFVSTGDNKTDTESYDQILTDYYSNKGNIELSSTSYDQKEETIQVEDEDGGHHPEKTITIEQNEPTTRSAGTVDDAAQAQATAEGVISGISQRVGRVVNFGCTALMLGSSIASAISGITTAIYFNNYLITMEPISKMMSGEGDTSGINVLMNKMTERITADVDDPTNYTITGDSSIGDVSSSNDQQYNVGISIGQYSSTGSMVESPNMQATLAQSSYDKHAAARHSVEASSKVLLGALATFGVSRALCVKAQAALAAANIGTSIVKATIAIGTTIASGGIITVAGAVLWSSLKSILIQIGIGTLLNFTMTSVMSFAVPMLAKLLTNQAKKVLGIPGGEELMGSAAAFGSKTSRSNSGLSLATEENIAAYSRIYNDVLAQQAEVDRLNRSPFDITSKNTFLGSIAYQLFAIGISKPSSIMRSVLQTTSSSIASITQSTYADSVNQGQTTYMNTFGDCPVLEQIGAKGDIYCNPIVISDVSTLDIDPNNQTYVNIINQELEEKDDGTWSIKSDGDLAKYIAFCVDRQSPFGEVDASILDQLSNGNAIINAVPIVGDINQILDATEYSESESWANGAKCVASSSNPDWDTKIKYYQRYTEDQRILNQLHAYENDDGTSSVDPVTAFREEYRKANPIDNSPAGYLARISGTDKETAGLILDLVAYYNFLENYDPSTRIAMNEELYTNQNSTKIIANLESKSIHVEDTSSDTKEQFITITQHIIYADVRNRSYTV